MWDCPHCGEEVEDDFDICWSCGTNRAGQPDPAFDPEHDGIMDEKALHAVQEHIPEEYLVTVAIFRSVPEAHMVRSRLEAEGIPALVMNELAATTWGISAPDGVPLQVAEKDVPRARKILQSLPQSHLPADEEDEDLEDDENQDGRAPEEREDESDYEEDDREDDERFEDRGGFRKKP